VGLFDLTQIALERAMSGAALRQSVLANNVANANTPGFKRSDVDFESTLAQALDGAQPLEAVAFGPQQDNSAPVRADGNNVDVDTEMANLSENAVDYQALVAVSRTRLGMLQTVIGSGK
jgi:flagellar basal-body rod protein FlgB